MLAWFVCGSFVLVLLPCLRTIFCLGSPRVVSIGNEPFSYRRFILWAFFLPPEGFLLCRSPCQTDIVWFLVVCGGYEWVWWYIKFLFFDDVGWGSMVLCVVDGSV